MGEQWQRHRSGVNSLCAQTAVGVVQVGGVGCLVQSPHPHTVLQSLVEKRDCPLPTGDAAWRGTSLAGGAA